MIRIIRNEDEPKPRLMQRFKLTDMQAEAILNMRLRSLRRLEEMEIRKEHRSLSKERKDIQALLKDDALRWRRIAGGTRGDAAEVRLRRAGCAAHGAGVAPPRTWKWRAMPSSSASRSP